MDEERSIGRERFARDGQSGDKSANGFACPISMGRWTDTAARGPALGRSQCLSRWPDSGFAAGARNLEKVLARVLVSGANRNCGRIIIWKSPKKRRVP